ncbi:Sorbose dehydrogenase [Paraburkholderia unamae]|uniref:GMC family oxidoreductase n=1 Tax=Paraburkholderia unamae TaxID=219649 RepID=UPI001CAE54FF|nr:GMC family oxidoreductase N-terminal domain-containing protein [Paraburkholderia unamae]CAG9275174.1 Sorbose dehydrogenase [Paraburkholderia unamae]
MSASISDRPADPASSSADEQADYVIVGGGTAGAVLAARLSENGRHRVLLVEAGMDTPPDATPVDIRDTFPSSTLNPGYFWPSLEATVVKGGRPRPFPQAKVMGGGSSIMGMFALRGVPSDFERWSAAGAAGWSWEEAVRLYRKIEFDPARAVHQHGSSPIRCMPTDEWPPFVCAMGSAAGALGYPFVPDINEHPRDGFFPMPSSRNADTRSTSAGCYLTADVRRRRNLKIMADTRALRLVFDGRKAVGVEVERNGVASKVSGHRIVLSSGAIHSPTLLLRSGIGPATELTAKGIEPLLDLPGVGRNLQNHSYLFYALTLPRGKRLAQDLRRFVVAGVRASSNLPDCPASDLFVFALGRVSPRSFGVNVAMIGAALYSPFSKGAVTLASSDPRANPHIDFRMLDDPRDAPRVVQSARLAESLLCHPEMQASYNEAFLLPAAMAVNQFNRPGLAGTALAIGAQIALNAPGPLRRLAVRLAFKVGQPLARRRGVQRIPDDEILASIAPMGHPVGTCAMGDPSVSSTVVDSDYRVVGLENVFVVDASVMPVIPSANTNLPTLMVAEHAVERLLEASAEASVGQRVR